MWCRTCQHNLPADCFYAHKRPKYLDCKVCHSKLRRERRNAPSVLEQEKAKRRAAHAANPAKMRAAAKRYREANIERAREADRRHAAKHAEKKRLATAAWRAAHPDREKAMKERYRAENLPTIIARNKLRKTRQMRATPPWAEIDAMRVVYLKAAEWGERLGIKMHVDHIVPLNSELVCGLHCLANLQVLEGAENIRKQNTAWPDMPVSRGTVVLRRNIGWGLVPILTAPDLFCPMGPVAQSVRADDS